MDGQGRPPRHAAVQVVRLLAWRPRWPRHKPSLLIRSSRKSRPYDRDGGRGAEPIFRYAPLSSGLDVVRETLGQQRQLTA